MEFLDLADFRVIQDFCRGRMQKSASSIPSHFSVKKCRLGLQSWIVKNIPINKLARRTPLLNNTPFYAIDYGHLQEQVFCKNVGLFSKVEI
jgi:hypothetical protein